MPLSTAVASCEAWGTRPGQHSSGWSAQVHVCEPLLLDSDTPPPWPPDGCLGLLLLAKPSTGHRRLGVKKSKSRP